MPFDNVGVGAIWIAVHGVAAATSMWLGAHIGDRASRKERIREDAYCDECRTPLGWRQLPLIGQRRGCGQCGARGRKGAPWEEGCAGVTLAACAANRPKRGGEESNRD